MGISRFDFNSLAVGVSDAQKGHYHPAIAQGASNFKLIEVEQRLEISEFMSFTADLGKGMTSGALVRGNS